VLLSGPQSGILTVVRRFRSNFPYGVLFAFLRVWVPSVSGYLAWRMVPVWDSCPSLCLTYAFCYRVIPFGFRFSPILGLFLSLAAIGIRLFLFSGYLIVSVPGRCMGLCFSRTRQGMWVSSDVGQLLFLFPDFRIHSSCSAARSPCRGLAFSSSFLIPINTGFCSLLGNFDNGLG